MLRIIFSRVLTKVQYFGIFNKTRALFNRQPMKMLSRSFSEQHTGGSSNQQSQAENTLFDTKTNTIKQYPTDIFRNLKNFFQIAKLNATCDPNFSVEAFKIGANQVRYTLN